MTKYGEYSSMTHQGIRRGNDVGYLSFVPPVFKFSSSYANFNMGEDGPIYYPSKLVNGETGAHPTYIDFAHDDFFFAEETRTKLTDFQ